jgi:hypothetical protein
MKKIFMAAIIAASFVTCQNEANNPTTIVSQEQSSVDMSDFYVVTEENYAKGEKERCHSMRVLNKQLKEDSKLYKKMYDIEYATRAFIAAKKGGNGNGNGNGGGGNTGGGGGDTTDNLGVINIPVYVHVVYSNSQENISDTQIMSQINVLNDDFRRTNSDANATPSEFAGVATDTEVTFTLAGTFRHADSRTSWGTNDAVKSSYPPITPETHLNIWVCNIGNGILGYAQFPGGNLSTDGVVCGPNYFGNTGYVSSPYNEGRTMTHEVGHYLNLRHIWGDGRCRQDDFVSDTPSSDSPNYGCPTYPTVNCRSNDMTMNYMDYTNDACMNMFTDGQKSRMRAIFQEGGARASMIN